MPDNAAPVGTKVTKGGEFLLRDFAPEEIFTAEDLNEEQQAIGRMVDDFWAKEVVPHLPAIRNLTPGAARAILRKSADLGLTGITIPEHYGGMELDLASSLVVAQRVAREASYMMWEGGHCTIGTLPLVYFGTEAQKQKYLPKILTVDMLAAYALSEPEAGSDALAVKTRADLNPAGTHYILNGQKMWITNGAEADLFTVFAKVGGEKFTAFLVERSFGVKHGAEEHKMGLKGSSTTALYFDNVPVPVENVLGEIGRGHIIAFNVLNMGRLKIGASTTGAAIDLLRTSIRYAKDRKAFGGPISNLGAIQHKLAEMAIRIYAVESMLWRTVGLIQDASKGVTWDHPDAAKIKLQSIAEFAAECSILKVAGSEMLDFVVDEAIQIHGGYGFHEDYGVERVYRDARVNRIFEGTNEINRTIISGMLIKRSVRGESNLIIAAKRAWEQATGVQSDIVANATPDPVHRAKQLVLSMIHLAVEAHGDALDKQQEIVMLISDAITEVFAMESCLLRTQKRSPRSPQAAAMTAVLLEEAFARIQSIIRAVIISCSPRGSVQANLNAAQRMAARTPADVIALRREIAARLIAREQMLV
jgi:alkylation response protein AidB-like acyl-CoA dehydrogenase